MIQIQFIPCLQRLQLNMQITVPDLAYLEGSLIRTEFLHSTAFYAFKALRGMCPFRPSPYDCVVVVAVSGFPDCWEDEYSPLAADNPVPQRR